ncbi:BON domain-containing protein [Vogesella oryzae]|uniref:BON domain-containing protein n=1 Tax=Vogesella oryzae TaxID=1735285 RepID=UPI0015814B8C|nr:BON domain-containing protein [Vogesella oryzae]
MKNLIRLSVVVALLSSSMAAFAGEAEDMALAEKVKTAIDASSSLKPFNLKVSSKNNDVTIEGSVNEGLQMAEAGMIAEKVEGVKYVFNNIVPKQ